MLDSLPIVIFGGMTMLVSIFIFVVIVATVHLFQWWLQAAYKYNLNQPRNKFSMVITAHVRRNHGKGSFHV